MTCGYANSAFQAVTLTTDNSFHSASKKELTISLTQSETAIFLLLLPLFFM
jgi:hypothetical protein